jgi:hypothetical protein
MRKTLALLALVGVFALTAIAFGSPPTEKRETVSKNTRISTVKTDAANVTADTSAVATRDPGARTVEAAPAATLNPNETAENGTAHDVSAAVAANRCAVSPPERLQNVVAERDVSLTDRAYNYGAGMNRRTCAVLKV